MQRVSAKRLFRVSGRVIDLWSHRGLPGLRVEAWDEDRRSDEFIGDARTDERGAFQIEFGHDRLRDLIRDGRPDLFFHVYWQDSLIASTEHGIHWSVRYPDQVVLIPIDSTVLDQPPKSGPTPTGYVVRGQVRDAQGAVIPGIRVEAFDKDLRTESRLGSATTDADGRYEIHYQPGQLSRPEKGVADLVVRAYAADGSLLVESPVNFNVAAQATIDLMVGGGQYPGSSEYERLSEELAPLLQGVAPADLDGQDITFLAGETGDPAERVAFYATSARLEQTTKVTAPAFYGLFRQALPADLPHLLAQSPLALRTALEASLDQNIVPIALRAQLDAILDALHRLAVQQSLENPVAGQASLGAVLGTVIAAPELQQKLVSTYVSHQGPVQDFWKAIRADPAFGHDSVVDKIQGTLQFALVSQNHLPLLTALQADPTLQSPQDLAKLDGGAWRKLIDPASGGAGVPADVPGRNDQEKVSNFVDLVSGIVEEAFPTRVAVSRTQQNPFAGSDDVLKFFAASPGFDLKRTNVDQYVYLNPGAVAGLQDKSGTIERIKSTQRLLRVTNRYESAQTLLDQGFHSAHSIAQIARRDFVANYGGQLGGFAAAEAVHARAQLVSGSAMALFAKYGLTINNLGLAVTPDPPTALEGFPNWESLFGSLDLCACDHCRSVYGPAAYLVDILAFLQTRPSRLESTSALQVLLGRRPDIGDIELSCANAETPLPYVDLVNEVLETVVSPTTAVPARQRQTSWSAEELAANPQYINLKSVEVDGAYERLAKAVYPWTLPFDLWFGQVGIYLDYLGVTRDQLMKTFQQPGASPQPSEAEIAAARLGLSSVDRQIINGTAPGDPGIYWGQTALNPTALQGVRTVLDRSGLTYAELFALLGTDFIRSASPDKRFDIVSTDPQNPDTCDTNKLTIPEMNAEGLKRLHRFTRLWRKLGWAIHELDRAIAVLRATDLDDALLIELAAINQLRADLNLPIEQLLAFYGSIDTSSSSPSSQSLYGRLFLNKRVLNPQDPAFALSGNELAVIGQISAHVPAILAALQLSAADFAALVAAELSDDKLNLANLSSLYRYATLKRALKVRMTDLLTLEALIGNKPFTTPATTAEFVRRVTSTRGANLSIARLDYLYRHHSDPTHKVAPTPDAISVVLMRLQNALSRVVDDTAMVDNVTDDLLHQKLAAVLADPAAQRAVSFVVSIPVDTPDNRAFIRLNFPFLDPAEAFSKLLVTVPPPTEDLKAAYRRSARTYVLERLLAFLRRTLSESAITQALSDAVKLESGVAAELLRSVLKAQTDSTRPAMADYLALVGDGLLATYFQNADLTNQKVTRVESGIDLVWGSGTPDSSIVPGFSLRLSGKLLVPYRETYTFSIRTNGGVRLWIDGQLLIDQWTNALPAELEASAPIVLATTEQLHDIKLEYWTGAVGDAFLQLNWASRSTPHGVVSPHLLFSGAGLTKLDAVVKSYTLLFKAALVAGAFKMTPRELTYLTAHGGDFGGFDPNALPLDLAGFQPAMFAQFGRLTQLFTLRDSFPIGQSDLFDIFSLASDSAPTIDQVKDRIADASGWDRQELNTLMDAGGFGLAAGDFRNEIWLIALQECFALRRRLGVSAAKLLSWARNSPNQAQAEDVKNTAKAQYDEPRWLSIAGPLRDQLREQQRAALVAYLVVHPELAAGANWRSADDLFTYFLVDVQMSPCQLTSRIKQAIGAVQLFIQRCLMNLEPDVTLSAEDHHLWQWMKNYRVWEANRKVFLYPENWIEPSLRDNKSPFFKDLENALLQNEVTEENAEDAFLKYLEKLDTVARLEVMGEFHQVESDWKTEKQVDIFHTIARTRGGTPNSYYHRQRLGGLTWSPWQRIDLDIDSDDVLPVIFNRRLYLFWPVFKEKTETAQIPPKGEQGAEPRKHFTIQLAWSEYQKNKWLAKKVSKVSFDTDRLLYAVDETRTVTTEGLLITTTDKVTETTIAAIQSEAAFTFKAQFTPDHDLWIGCYARTVRKVDVTLKTRQQIPFLGIDNTFTYVTHSAYEDRRSELFGAFQVGCHGDVSVKRLFDYQYPPSKTLVAPPGTEVSAEVFAESPGQSSLQLPWESNPTTLSRTPTRFQLVYAHQDPEFRAQRPFFYQDADRTFFVEPIWINASVSSQFQSDGISISSLPYYKLFEQQLSKKPPPGDPGPSMTLTDPLAATPSFPALSVVDSQLFVQSNAAQLPGTSLAGSATATAFAGTNGPVAAAIAAPPVIGQADRIAAAIASGAGAAPAAASAGPLAKYSGYDPAAEKQLAGWQELLFETFYHPYVCLFLRELNGGGIDALLQRPIQTQPQIFSNATPLDFETQYQPVTSVVAQPYPVEDVDFSASGSYSLYNWEVFFHVPLLIASRLSQNQRFEDAQRWFHYIFDPTDRSSFQAPQRFWHVKPFFEAAIGKPIVDLLKLVASSGYSHEKQEFQKQIKEWQDNPFDPHLIARARISAYQKTVVMKYLDNLIAWGDQLFRRETIEAINEATLLYVLAAQILGRRPEQIPARAQVAASTFNELTQVGDFSDPLVQIENLIQPTPPADGGTPQPVPSLLPRTLYFCVPKNAKLLGYWDTVADRLFKIRHCMNIQGVVRQLPLFEPAIDPALLVRAAAAGIDIGSVLNDLNAPLPHYRFTTMLQKASELCAEVRGLGAALLAALEKRDGEGIALLRSTNEIQALQATRDIKAQALNEAQRNLEAATKSREMVDIRHTYYANIEFMNDAEKLHLVLEGVSAVLQAVSQGLEIAAGVAAVFPTITTGAAGWAASPVATIAEGGSNFSSELQSAGKALSILASITSAEAQMSQTVGGYRRRADDWKLQADVSAKELEQLDKQLLAGEIRIAVAQKDLDNQDMLIDNAKSVDQVMHDKFTNQDLYDWMVSQVSTIYFQSHQLAYDLAKRAEKAYQFERASTETFIEFGYWDSLKKGLLAGEKLSFDLKRMDTAYLDQNRRDYEVTKHVSLAMLDPVALVMLKETGQCFFNLPESLFDSDHPGQYMRRIKSASVSIPCVVGPYTSLNGRLTLLWNTVRSNPSTPGGNYLRATTDGGVYADDDRFIDDLGATQSIVTSTGQNDSGMFEVNLHDERYLPFEGRGVVSQWRLELPPETNAFDFTTIADVILQVRYTSRDGGDVLKQKAGQAVVAVSPRTGVRLFSARHEFPSDWYAFLTPPAANDGQSLSLNLSLDRFPFLAAHTAIKVGQLDFYLKVKDERAYRKAPGLPLPLSVTAPDTTVSSATMASTLTDTGGLPHGSVSYDGAEQTTGIWNLAAAEADIKKLEQDFHQTAGTHERINPDAIVDLWVVCHYLIQAG